MSRPKIILDCDPGVDDAFAILTALRHTDLTAITTVMGNVSLELTTRNALLVTQVAGAEVPVFAGAADPLVIERADASHVHGNSGLDGPVLPELTRTAESMHAVDALLDLTSDGDVTVVPIGPLTNIALAIKRDPSWAKRIPGIVLMGGSTDSGNVTAAAEFNIFADPHAAAVVFESGANITMLGLNLTRQVRMGEDHIGQLRAANTATSVFCADLLEHYAAFSLREYGVPRSAMHDPTAVLMVSHPQHFETEPFHVAAETEGRHTIGMTLVDQRENAAPPNATVAMSADADPVIDLIMTAATDPHPKGARGAAAIDPSLPGGT